MTIRRILLIILLTTLAASALSGVLVFYVPHSDSIFGLLFSAIGVAVTTGLMLPLTLLTDRPKFRVGGLAAMLFLILLLLSILGTIWAEFSRDWRLSSSFAAMIGFTLLFCLPAAGALMVVHFRWARFAAWTFAGLAALGFGLCLLGAVAEYFEVRTSYRYRWSELILVSGLVSYGIGTLCSFLLVNVRCGDRRYFRWPGVALGVSATIMTILGNGLEVNTHSWWKFVVVQVFLCAALAHTNLVLMARLRASQSWLKWATLGCSYVAGMLFIFCFLAESEEIARIAVVPAMAAISGSLALIVLAFFNRKPNLPERPLPTTPMNDIHLTCPRCGSAQTLPVGESVCQACELQISIKVTEPRCPGCGYLLYQLTSRNCPECGALVRPNAPEIPSPEHTFPVQPSPPQPLRT